MWIMIHCYHELAGSRIEHIDAQLRDTLSGLVDVGRGCR